MWAMCSDLFLSVKGSR